MSSQLPLKPQVAFESLSPTAQIELLEQNITYLLQEIDANFSVTHKNLEGELLPRVEKLGAVSKRLLDICKPWLQFFEIFARPVPGEADGTASVVDGQVSFNYPLDDIDEAMGYAGMGDRSGGWYAPSQASVIATPDSVHSRLVGSIKVLQTPSLAGTPAGFRSIRSGDGGPSSTLQRSQPRQGSRLAHEFRPEFSLATAHSHSKAGLSYGPPHGSAARTSFMDPTQHTPSKIGSDLYGTSLLNGDVQSTIQRPVGNLLSSFDGDAPIMDNYSSQPHRGGPSASDEYSFSSTPSDIRRFVIEKTPRAAFSHGRYKTAPKDEVLDRGSVRDRSQPYSVHSRGGPHPTPHHDISLSHDGMSPEITALMKRYATAPTASPGGTPIASNSATMSVKPPSSSELTSPAPSTRIKVEKAATPQASSLGVDSPRSSRLAGSAAKSRYLGQTDRRLSLKTREIEDLLFDDPESTALISELTRKYDFMAPEADSDDDNADINPPLLNQGLYTSGYRSSPSHGGTGPNGSTSSFLLGPADPTLSEPNPPGNRYAVKKEDSDDGEEGEEPTESQLLTSLPHSPIPPADYQGNDMDSLLDSLPRPHYTTAIFHAADDADPIFLYQNPDLTSPPLSHSRQDSSLNLRSSVDGGGGGGGLMRHPAATVIMGGMLAANGQISGGGMSPGTYLNNMIGDETVQVVLSNESPCAPKSVHWSKGGAHGKPDSR
ncbi:hypothetical protein BJ085DRAFT_41493 [Dimargaris cristalligena]|uniref:DASH complex subunit ASK1 n=1 Tax=Dimargaris cristalligena TaxID=215637 RepID=A0A4P9ZTY9_9FUNG|nr:hypothetical protein BJ085DRAFT_41493 [Dimargaris cristalligena]|eukprot:RKP37003.1 hypothetical protein BJ085DRAFT_41493 [Dimargaris cristalligena]